METPSAADFIGAFLGSADPRHHKQHIGVPANIAAFGRHKVRPTLRKQLDVMVLWLQMQGEANKRRMALRVPSASPATPTVSRQVRRYLTREFDKDRAPLRNNIVQVLKARAIAERNEKRPAERQPGPSLESYT